VEGRTVSCAADSFPARRRASSISTGRGEPEWYEGIQVLRAVAALLVLVAHACFVHPTTWAWLVPSSIGGAVGVDVFFVISGFVVAMAADRPGLKAGSFLLGRATRVLPLYLVFSLPFLAFGTVTWQKSWNTLAFLPVFDHGTYSDPAHWFGWSIGAELWFYLVFAALVRWAPENRRTEAFAVVAVLLVATGRLHHGDWVLPRFIAMPMMLEFAAGALLYKYRRMLGPAAALFLAPIGAAMLVYVASGFPLLGLHHHILEVAELGSVRAVVWGVPAILLVAGVVGLDHCRLRWPAPLVKVGDWSYSVYLVQPIAILALEPLQWPHWLLAWAALLVLVLVMAWASHRWVERPATAWLRAMLSAAKGGGAAGRGNAPLAQPVALAGPSP
jgi:exopolysaccharide production protein ExoZ